VELAQFIEVCEDNLGMGELMEYLEEYIFALQYPGLTEAEAQERLEKKLQKNKAMSQATQ
jgi:23S rRNA maturation-related 3'-5' exoribonuclease YhaM